MKTISEALGREPTYIMPAQACSYISGKSGKEIGAQGNRQQF
jgi:hypothetical protein